LHVGPHSGRGGHLVFEEVSNFDFLHVRRVPEALGNFELIRPNRRHWRRVVISVGLVAAAATVAGVFGGSGAVVGLRRVALSSVAVAAVILFVVLFLLFLFAAVITATRHIERACSDRRESHK